MKFSWTDRVQNEDVLHGVMDQRYILHTIKITKDKWMDDTLRRNFLLKHIAEGNTERRIEVKGRRGRRRKQLLDVLKEKDDIRDRKRKH